MQSRKASSQNQTLIIAAVVLVVVIAGLIYFSSSQKPATTTTPKASPRPKAKSSPRPAPKTSPKFIPVPVPEASPKTKAKADPKPAPKAKPKPGARPSAKTSGKSDLPDNKVPVVASIGYSTSADLGEAVSFSAAGSIDPDGEIVKYLWHFGDGTTALGKNVKHTYSVPGSYVIYVDAEDDEGGKANTIAAPVLSKSTDLRLQSSALIYLPWPSLVHQQVL
mgnify:CR=1 FL=1